MEFCLLHDIVAKALCVKAGYFDMVTSEKFDLIVVITAGLKVVNKKIMVVSETVEAGSQAVPAKSTSETSLDVDSLPLSRLKRRGAAPKRKLIMNPSNSETTMSIPQVQIKKNQRTQRQKQLKQTSGDRVDYKSGPNPEIPAEGAQGATAGEPEAHTETTTVLETRAGDESIACDPEGHVRTTPEQEERVDGTDSNIEEHEGVWIV
ncbi:hypothetical protein F511_16713 [Dorcoceras hygrometricum]|uniref:Uncharacterized protein n=1 Tax=Dorcoceras hygrometricum TaxID=472368 RepID=A0A2Z7BBP8_9LAMI|nr:hypothetical protein F511_16713 [Dorcoceras hygrometricum]